MLGRFAGEVRWGAGCEQPSATMFALKMFAAIALVAAVSADFGPRDRRAGNTTNDTNATNGTASDASTAAAATTTAAAATDAPTKAPKPQAMKITINGDYGSLNSTAIEATKASVKSQIVSTTALTDADIASVTLAAGSIVATITFTGDVTEDQVKAASAEIEKAIAAGTFKILVNGVPVTAQVGYTAPVATTTAPQQVIPKASATCTAASIAAAAAAAAVAALL